MRKLFLLLIVAVLLGLGLSWLATQGGGYVLLTWGGHAIEMTAGMALLLNLLLLGIAWFVLKIVRKVLAVGGIKAWWLQLFNERYRRKTERGIQQFLQGHYRESSQVLQTSATRAELPEINFLLAADGALAEGDTARATSLIDASERFYGKPTLASGLARVRVLFQQRNYRQAAELLEKIYLNQPRHNAVLKLLAECHRTQQNWLRLEELLPHLRKYRVYTGDSLLKLEVQVYSAVLRLSFWQQREPNADNDKYLQQIEEQWQSAPKMVRQEEKVLVSYSQSLIQLGHPKEAEKLLRKRINSQWSGQLARRYCDVVIDDGSAQLKVAEQWVAQQPEDANLLTGLGVLCRAMKLEGKARDYFSAAVSIKPSIENLQALAELVNRDGDKEKAMGYLQQALQLR